VFHQLASAEAHLQRSALLLLLLLQPHPRRLDALVLALDAGAVGVRRGLHLAHLLAQPRLQLRLLLLDPAAAATSTVLSLGLVWVLSVECARSALWERPQR
jgi:hypothetical protein